MLPQVKATCSEEEKSTWALNLRAWRYKVSATYVLAVHIRSKRKLLCSANHAPVHKLPFDLSQWSILFLAFVPNESLQLRREQAEGMSNLLAEKYLRGENLLLFIYSTASRAPLQFICTRRPARSGKSLGLI